MIRAFYRDRIQRGSMSRSHPALQRFNHKLGGMSTRNLDDLVDRDALEAETQAGLAAARARQAEASRRVHHPAITAPEFKCFRVVRQFKGEDYGEDIGAFHSEGAALLMLAKELAWAIVISPNGKRHAFNFQPMTERP